MTTATAPVDRGGHVKTSTGRQCLATRLPFTNGRNLRIFLCSESLRRAGCGRGATERSTGEGGHAES